VPAETSAALNEVGGSDHDLRRLGSINDLDGARRNCRRVEYRDGQWALEKRNQILDP
jgi:hypothetical protein